MPFTVEQFFNVFLGYNTSVFPFQIILFVAGIISLTSVIIKSKFAGIITSYLLVILWLWNGIVYHICFFSGINKAAIAFGTLFILQAVFFLIEFVIKKRLVFSYGKKSDMIIGYFMILFGLIIYPVIGLISGKEIGYIISFGLPCPSVIFTFGIIIASKKNYTLYKLIIPVIWAFIGFFAAVKFGVYHDVALPVSAAIAVILFFKERNILIPF